MGVFDWLCSSPMNRNPSIEDWDTAYPPASETPLHDDTVHAHSPGGGDGDDGGWNGNRGGEETQPAMIPYQVSDPKLVTDSDIDEPLHGNDRYYPASSGGDGASTTGATGWDEGDYRIVI